MQRARRRDSLKPIHIGCSGWNYASWRNEFYGGRPASEWLAYYSKNELEDWAQRFERWSERVEIFAYFKNDWEVFAVRNALALERMLATRHAPADPA